MPHARFRLDDAPRHERYDLWRDSIACVFEVEAPKEVRGGGDFSAEIDAHMLGPVMLARTQILEQVMGPHPGAHGPGRDGPLHDPAL